MTDPSSHKNRFLCQSVTVFCLLLICVVYTTRLVQLGGGGVIFDVADVDAASLSSRTLEFIEQSAPNRLHFTFFVSSREAMPTHLKGVEDHVRLLLQALRDVDPERIDFRIIDPQVSGASAVGYAASKKISPVSVRGVRQDEHSETRIWSSLAISYEGQPDIYIQDIQTRDLPRLEDWIRARLVHVNEPLQPSFALSAPAGFDELPRYLSQHGPVVSIDLSRGPHLPSDTDVLFWIEPENVSERHIRTIKRYLEGGRTVVMAGSAYEFEYHLPGSTPAENAAYRVQRRSAAWEQLLRPFGLKPIPDLLMDRNAGPVTVVLSDGTSRSLETSFHLRNLPAFRDFRRLTTPARGGLSFVAASALQIDPLRVAQAGFQAEIVATTTEHARVLPLPSGMFTDAALASAVAVPKQNLMVLLSAGDAWSGQLLVLASAAPFRDGIISQSGYGHTVFLNDLVRSFASVDRLVRLRTSSRMPDVLQPTGLGQRLFWRIVAVAAIPVLLLMVGVWRYRRGGNSRGLLLVRARWSMAHLKYGGIGLALAILLATGLLSSWDRFGIDLTRDQLNTPASSLQGLLDENGDGLEVDYLLSPRSHLPPGMRSVERRVRSMLATLDVEVTTRHPETRPDAERRQLVNSGVRPFEIELVLRDTVISSQIWSGLRLRLDGRAAVIRRLDERTIEHFDFLLTAAVKRLTTKGARRVAVVSDLPRLSPAEALEDYQKRGLSAPRGADVYSRLKTLLGDYGYEVDHVNPRQPVLPDDADAVLWLQPRRDSGPVILQLGDYLADGGRAIVAMQHFNIQQRQYRGIGFQTVYWPQPQFQDFDRYLRLTGVEQVREVLMDRTRHHLTLDTQVNRTAVREYDAQQVALPFLIRSVNAFYSDTSPLTQSLGDLLFIWGNRFELREEELRQHGLTSRPLISTSDQSWSYGWQGGWLPEAVFSPTALLPGPQTLVVQLEGRFPRVEFVKNDEGREELAIAQSTGSKRGALLLVGSSEMFKNDYLFAQGFQHDQFLLNALAQTVHGTDMALLQSRHRQPHGFQYLPASTKLWWRLITIAGGPVLLLGLLLLWRRRRGPFETQPS